MFWWLGRFPFVRADRPAHSHHNENFSYKYRFLHGSADVRYLRTSLFSQNERARLCERVSFVKTNEYVNIVRKHFPWWSLFIIQLFREGLWEKMCTRQCRKVMWDMINTLFLTTVAVEPTFVAFYWHSPTHFHGLSCQFFQISLKKRELKTTPNAFQDCRMHCSRQPFSK